MREADRFRSRGAVGVIPKPFDPMTLTASVRIYVQPATDPLAHLRNEFLLRVKRDAAALSEACAALRERQRAPETLEQVKQVAHALSGASGIYGFAELSDAAANLKDMVMAELAGQGSSGATDRAIKDLMIQAAHCRAVTGPGHAADSSCVATAVG